MVVRLMRPFSQSLRQGQNSLDELIREFLPFFKEREVSGFFEPDKFFLRSSDPLAVVPDKNWTAVRIESTFQEKDWNTEVRP